MVGAISAGVFKNMLKVLLPVYDDKSTFEELFGKYADDIYHTKDSICNLLI